VTRTRIFSIQFQRAALRQIDTISSYLGGPIIKTVQNLDHLMRLPHFSPHRLLILLQLHRNLRKHEILQTSRSDFIESVPNGQRG
jgi:hypothetical protein